MANLKELVKKMLEAHKASEKAEKKFKKLR